MTHLRRCVVILVTGLAGCTDPGPTVLASQLFAPTEVALDGDRVVFLQANGELDWVTRDGAQRGVLAPGVFTPRPGQIPVDADSIDVAVGPDQIAWTDHVEAGARLWTVPRAGGAPVLRETVVLGRIADVTWHGDRLCWLEPLALRCADHVGDAARTVVPVLSPRALALTEDTVYWLEAGVVPRRSHDGRLVSAKLDGSERRVLAALLEDPRDLAIAGGQVFWLDAGSCTDSDTGCIGNHDAALRRIGLDGGAAITHSGGHGSIGGLAVIDDDVYFCADGDVSRAHGLVTEPLNVGHGCQYLAIDDGELVFSTFDQILRFDRSP
jgi:hypothetical protein